MDMNKVNDNTAGTFDIETGNPNTTLHIEEFNREEDQDSSIEDANIENLQHDEQAKKKCSCAKLTHFFSFHENNEAKGLALNKIPEACAIVATSVYLSTATVQLAYEAAGCEDINGDKDYSNCDRKVYGTIKPSSLISLFVLILGICSAVVMPLLGAFLDYSNRRRLVGGLTALGVTIVTFAEAFISHWFILLLLQLLSLVLLTTNTCVSLAYYPELTDDKHLLAKYNTLIFLFNSIAVVVYLGIMTGITVALNITSALESARISLFLAFVPQAVIYSFTWTKMIGPREAANVKSSTPTNNSKCNFITSGLKSLKVTFVKAFKQRKEVRWFLCFRAISSSVLVSFAAAVISYLNEQIQITSTNIGITSLIVLFFAIPGNKLSLTIMDKHDPLISLKVCMLLFSTLGPALSLLVYKQGQETRLYIIAAIMGLLMGWKEPSDKTLLCSLIPKGIEGEMAGLYVFASQVLVWLPSLLFTVMNENGVNIRIGIGSFGIYFLLSFIVLIFMGDYDSILASTALNERELFFEHNEGEGLRARARTRSASESDLGSMYGDALLERMDSNLSEGEDGRNSLLLVAGAAKRRRSYPFLSEIAE